MYEIKLRKVMKKDKLVLYNWFNDTENIKNKLLTNSKITIEEHSLWFKNFLDNKNNVLWIIHSKNYLIGQIRLDYISKQKYEIDIYLEKKYRSKNIASDALAKAEKKLLSGSIIISKVKKTNERSLRFFISNGYISYFQNDKASFLKKEI